MNQPNVKQQCPLHADACSHRLGERHRLANLTPYEYWLRETERENRRRRTQFGPTHERNRR